jgi:hypothetical protein
MMAESTPARKKLHQLKIFSAPAKEESEIAVQWVPMERT